MCTCAAHKLTVDMFDPLGGDRPNVIDKHTKRLVLSTEFTKMTEAFCIASVDGQPSPSNGQCIDIKRLGEEICTKAYNWANKAIPYLNCLATLRDEKTWAPVERVIPLSVSDEWEPLAGAMLIKIDNGGTSDLAVLVSPGGKLVLLRALYYSFFRKKYKGGQFYTDMSKPIKVIYVFDGEVVGGCSTDSSPITKDYFMELLLSDIWKRVPDIMGTYEPQYIVSGRCD